MDHLTNAHASGGGGVLYKHLFLIAQGDVGLDGWVISKHISEMQGVRTLAEFNWLRVRPSSGLL